MENGFGQGWIQIVGLLAGTLTTIAFVPQVLHAWTTGSVRDLSLAMLLTFNAGVLLWLAYGIALGALPIIAANAITLPMAVTLLILKLRQ